MYSAFVSVPLSGDELLNWEKGKSVLESIVRQEISDSGYRMYSFDESTVDNPSRDFWWDGLTWDLAQQLREFCKASGYGCKVYEAVQAFSAHSMRCPKCGCEQMIEDGKAAMPCIELPAIVKCQECGSLFHPVKWVGNEDS